MDNPSWMLTREGGPEQTVAPYIGETGKQRELLLTWAGTQGKNPGRTSNGRKTWIILDQFLKVQCTHTWDLKTPVGPSHRRSSEYHEISMDESMGLQSDMTERFSLLLFSTGPQLSSHQENLSPICSCVWQGKEKRPFRKVSAFC